MTNIAGTNLEGVAELTQKLRLLGSPKEQFTTLKAAVRAPMRDVMKVAKVNLGKISPGKTELHRTYKGRLVAAGFALRSLRVIVVASRDKQSVSALLGVRKEAFYALQFFELGTAYLPAQPWLVPAFEASRNAAIAGIGKTMRKRIEKIAKMRSVGSGGNGV